MSLRGAKRHGNVIHLVSLRTSAHAGVAISFLKGGFPRQFANWLGMTVFLIFIFKYVKIAPDPWKNDCEIIFFRSGFGDIAQLVEQMTFNHWVQGSSPCVPTKKETHRKVVFPFVWGLDKPPNKGSGRQLAKTSEAQFEP